jgi:2-polyprenyl-6-methoxyphenol hydroxylase-like FAD-dependent oxidoreductase
MHDPRWLSWFHSDERQVPRYRAGWVFLVGDAAHAHSPAAGRAAALRAALVAWCGPSPTRQPAYARLRATTSRYS